MNETRQPRALSLVPVALFAVIWLVLLWIHQPSRYYFFGDAWDMLYGFLVDWKNVLRPHNEYFLPLFKGLFFTQYKVFRASHLPYMMVAFALHAANAVLIYLLGKSFSLRSWASLLAAGLFAFSAVHWEVTGSSLGQCTMLSALCMLLAIYLFRELPHGGATLVWVAALSLAAFWSGPPPLWLPVLLSVIDLQSSANESERVSKKRRFLTLLAIWTPAIAYLASLRAVATLASVLSVHNTRLSLANLPGMLEYTWFGVLFGLISPSLTGRQGYSAASNLVNGALFGLFLALSYRHLSTRTARKDFWFLAAFVLLPYPVISLGRLQLGVALAASSRYQYMPLVGLSLLTALCWQSLQNSVSLRRMRYLLVAVGSLLLTYYLLRHAQVIRKGSLAAHWGLSAQRFLQQAKQATYPAAIEPGVKVLGPELLVPDSVYPARTLPLWRVLQILEGNRERLVPTRDYIQDKDASLSINLIRNGGFEHLLEGDWNADPDVKVERSAATARTGRFGATILLPRGSALRQDVMDTCPQTLSGKILSFSVQVRTERPEPLYGRIVFKNQRNNVLEAVGSPRQLVDNQWHLLVVSALSPQGTCIASVEVANGGCGPIIASLDDAIAIVHPATTESSRASIPRQEESVTAAQAAALGVSSAGCFPE